MERKSDQDKTCTRCGILKARSPEEFGPSSASKDGFRYWCRECDRAYSRARGQQRYLDPSYREKKKAYSRQYRRKNPEKAYRATRNWVSQNPERDLELKVRYKARKKGATIGVVDYAAILERDGLWCYLCRSDVDLDDVNFDHVIPLSKGGDHSMENIKVTHAFCNQQKFNHLITVPWASSKI